MTPDEYQLEARKTAIYPDNVRVIYPTLGLAGEAGELAAALGDRTDGDLLGELGDVCWYGANLATDLGVKLSELPSAPALPASRIVELVGQVAEQVKKSVRDHAGEVPDKRRRLILDALAGLYASLEHLAQSEGLDLEQVFASNVAKLRSRQQRGMLHGDGDHR